MTLVLSANAIPGSSTWVDSATLIGGGGGELETILARPRLAPDTDNSYVNSIYPASTAKTLTFTAPVDLTIKNALFWPVAISNGAVDNFQLNFAAFFSFSRIEVVSGTGPNVGESFISGFGIPCGCYTPENVTKTPEFNIQMDAGDVLEIDLYFIGGTTYGIYSIELTYDTGLSADDTTYFVGGTALPLAVATLAPSVAATGTITITGTPTAPGNTITISGPFDEFGNVSSGVGGTLTGNAGGVGANTWDTDTVGIENIRDEILANLQSGSNNWDGAYTFAAQSTNAIVVTRVPVGAVGNADIFLKSGANISVSSSMLTGGTSPIVPTTMATPDVDLTITSVFGLNPVGATFNPPVQYNANQGYFTSITVNAVAVEFGPVTLQPSNAYSSIWECSFDADAGDTIVVNGRAPGGILLYFAMAGVRR
jgi:hypothetical protein